MCSFRCYEDLPTCGEGGIRTHVPLRETRSPGVRARPDYATSPMMQYENPVENCSGCFGRTDYTII